jgi:predicted transcriptional regulator
VNDGAGFERTLRTVESEFTVADIATLDLKTCSVGDRVRDVLPWAQEMHINNVPVIGSEGAIIGVLENMNGDLSGESVPRPDARVADAMVGISPTRLVESREPLRSFLPQIAERPLYWLVLRERSIGGIVTPSDANKLPVRLAAYTMVTHLEALMLLAIEKIAESADLALAHLPADEQAPIRRRFKKVERGHLNVSLLHVTSLIQKAKILIALRVFTDPRARRDFEAIYDELRNPLMHTGDFVNDSLRSVERFARNLQRVRERTEQLLALWRGQTGIGEVA